MCCYRGAESKLGQFIVMVFRVLKTEEDMKSGRRTTGRKSKKMWIQIDWAKFFRMKFNGKTNKRWQQKEKKKDKEEERFIQMETEMFGKTERLFVVEKKNSAFLQVEQFQHIRIFLALLLSALVWHFMKLQWD